MLTELITNYLSLATPGLLALASLLSLPVQWLIWRRWFGNTCELREALRQEVGELVSLGYSWTLLKLVWFVVLWGGLTAALYHLLGMLLNQAGH